jgi:hypothetical protein
MRLRPSSGCHRDDRGDGAIGGQLALTVTRDFDAGSGALLAAALVVAGILRATSCSWHRVRSSRRVVSVSRRAGVT